MSNRDQGSFVGGFTLGMFAGAVGYFLFATEKGRKIKKDLAQEWEVARKTLPDRGEGLASFATIRDLLMHVKQRIDENVNETVRKAEPQAKKKHQPRKTTKFKGVKKIEI